MIDLQQGQTYTYRPGNGAYLNGQPVTVVKVIAEDAIRIRFSDGHLLTVRAETLHPHDPMAWHVTLADTPEHPQLADARTRPVWKRVVTAAVAVLDAQTQERQDSDEPDLPADLRDLAEHHNRRENQVVVAAVQELDRRARQLARIVSTTGDLDELARLITQAATAEGQARRERRAGREGHPAPQIDPAPPAPTIKADPERLDQAQRAMINTIALCIHRRYFLSDREPSARLVSSGVQAYVRGVQREEDAVTVIPQPTQPKGSALAQLASESAREAYGLSLEACQKIVLGRLPEALLLAERALEHRSRYLQASAQLTADRKKYSTGRFFHGEILSVREPLDGGGMIQYYTRLTLVWAEDGITLDVANAPQLEGLTGVQVGPEGWRSLCAWIEDQSERLEGRKQGRRQIDDEHLIYQEHDGYLKPRPALNKYPSLLPAFECLRRSLTVSDVRRSEIPEGHPLPGEHLPAPRLERERT